MDTKKEVSRVMSELRSAGSNKVSCSSNLYGALVMMRTTLLKSKEAQIQLVQAGCIPQLLNLLTPPTAAGTWLKTVDIVISILANMCLEEKAREEVISSKGLSTIVAATKCTEKESIHNRGVRAVANLIQHSSKSDELCNEVIDLEFHIFVAKRLMETKERECKQTYLRAVRLFGQRKMQLVKLIADTRSVQVVASQLKEDNEKLMQKSLRILYEFSALRCCANFVEQILAANILEELVQAAESSDDEISSLSLSVLLKLCEYENIRPPLGAAGLISTLMRLLDCERSHVNHISILNALCLCCFEAVNRHRLYQEKTLELFMSILNPEQLSDEVRKFSVLRDRIISCLVCFLYNDECFDKLLDLKLVSAIIGHLNKECNLQMSDGNWSKEVELILNGSKIEVKEIAVAESENNAIFHNENEQNNDSVDEVLSLSQSVNNINEDKHNDANDNGFSTELLSTSDHLDQEIMDISMDATQVIPPSGTQASRHTFSINSPTYQMEQHSWRLEDHTSGVTCKNYSEDFHQDDIINPNPVLEGGGKFSPYSPLSVGSSYYSPAYPSPAHSFGSSPRHSNFQTGSFILGSQSPRSSPAWSPSNSLHSEDTWSNSDPAGRSPSNLIQSPNYQQGQFSPLINPYPASPPSVYLIEERNIAENPLFISQVSNTSNQTVDSQADMFSEYPKSVFSEMSQQSVGRFSSFSEILKGENAKPIYSASEDEDEESENPINFQRSCDGHVEVSARELEDGHVGNCKGRASGGVSSMETEIANVKKTKHVNNKESPKIQTSTSNIKPIEEENATFSQSLLQTTNVPFITLNSESSFSESSPKHESSFETQEQLNKNEGNIGSEQLPEKVKQVDSDILSSSQISAKNSVKRVKKRFFKECSFPGKSYLSSAGDKPSSPHHPLGSLSPFRVQFDLPFNSPSMSPFSRYSNSPYASPNPYLSRPTQNFSSGGEGFGEVSSKNDKKSSGKISHPSDKPSTLLQCQPSCSSAGREDSNCLNEHENVQPSTSKSDKDKGGSDRLNRIKRKTEENILVLLSRISVKTDPSQHLPKYDVLSTLTKYIGVVPMPIQRCIRTLFRVFHNPHCFESVLLEQAPALIVKNLIMDQDGKFPSVLFKDQQEDGPQTNRKINFDDLFSCSQSSETPSDFEMQIQFEFGGDAYSNMMHQRSFRSDIFQPNFLFRGKSMSRGMSRDSSFFNSSMTTEDLTRFRIRSGINLMKAITSLALSRYGDGEIQRIFSRGTESEKLMCAISLLHMPIGCGPLQRRQIILKHDALHQVIPLLFCKEAPLVREGIVTALSLLAHLFRIQKTTPKIHKLINTCPESNSGSTDFQTNSEKNVNLSLSNKETQNVMNKASDDNITCHFEHNSDKFNLNLIVADDKSGGKKVFRACKEILMKKSEVFSAMLGGGYAEADKVDIEFSDVNLSGFEYILHYLHGCESGCAVIDLLSLKDSHFVSDCDKDCCLDTEVSDCLQCGEPKVQNEVRTDFTSSYLKPMILVGKAQNAGSLTDHFEDTSLKNSIGRENDTYLEFEAENKLENCSSASLTLSEESRLSENKESFSPSTNAKQTESNNFLTNDNLSGSTSTSGENDSKTITLTSTNPSTSSATAKENCNHASETTKQIDFILDRCIDILTVADRFLVHDLIHYLTSVLSHTCLYTRTVTDIIYLASTYKLNGLATDCVVEVLLSHTSRKDITALFQILRLELDNDTKKMLIDILTNLFTSKAACS